MQEIIVYDFRNTLEAILDILSEYSALKSNIKASHFEHIFSHYLAILSSLKSSSELFSDVFFTKMHFFTKKSARSEMAIRMSPTKYCRMF